MPGRRSELLRWTLVCGAAEFAGIAVAAGAIVLTSRLVGEPVTAATKTITLVAVIAAGLTEGIIVGGLQWGVLRRRFTAIPARSWVGVTALTGASLWFLGMLAPTLLAQAPDTAAAADSATMSGPPWYLQLVAGAIGGSAAGAVFGTAQWAVLRPHAERAGRWIWANTLGWTLGMVWIFGAASSMPADAGVGTAMILGAVGGVLGGLSVGLVTGLFLVRIEAAPPPESPADVPASADGIVRRVQAPRRG